MLNTVSGSEWVSETWQTMCLKRTIFGLLTTEARSFALMHGSFKGFSSLFFLFASASDFMAVTSVHDEGVHSCKGGNWETIGDVAWLVRIVEEILVKMD